MKGIMNQRQAPKRTALKTRLSRDPRPANKNQLKSTLLLLMAVGGVSAQFLRAQEVLDAHHRALSQRRRLGAVDASCLLRGMLQKIANRPDSKFSDFLEIREAKPKDFGKFTTNSNKKKMKQYAEHMAKRVSLSKQCSAADVSQKPKFQKKIDQLGEWKMGMFNPNNTRAEYVYSRLSDMLEGALGFRLGFQCYDPNMITFLLACIDCLTMTPTGNTYKDTISTWSGTKKVTRKYYNMSLNSGKVDTLCADQNGIQMAQKLLWLLLKRHNMNENTVKPLQAQMDSLQRQINRLKGKQNKSARTAKRDELFKLKMQVLRAQDSIQDLKLQIQEKHVNNPAFSHFLRKLGLIQ